MANNQNDKIDVDELYQAIIVEYDTTKSIAEIARKLGTSQVRVQRVLITEGLWTSKRTEQIAELKAQGLSVEQIAEQLGKDVKTIQTFVPYSRGQYGKSETDDAARSKEYRDRMHASFHLSKQTRRPLLRISEAHPYPHEEEKSYRFLFFLQEQSDRLCRNSWVHNP